MWGSNHSAILKGDGIFLPEQRETMFPEDFFDDYLNDLVGIRNKATRVTGNQLLRGLIALASDPKSKITTRSLLAKTGVTRNQFYYLANGITGIWGHLLTAALYYHDRLTPGQRITIVEAASRLELSRELSFPEATSLMLGKNFPLRRTNWAGGFVLLLNERMTYMAAGQAGSRDWVPSNDDMISSDWELALPYKTSMGAI